MEQPKPVEAQKQDPLFPDTSKCAVCGIPAVYTLGKWGKWLAGYCVFHFFEKAAQMVRAIGKEQGWNFEGYETDEDKENGGGIPR